MRWSTQQAHQPTDTPIAYAFRLNNHTRTFYLRTHAGDIQIFYDIFWRSIYQLPATVFSSAHTIIDAGAHVGITAAYFREHAPHSIVYCIEADADNYELLSKNMQQDINNHKVIAVHAAIHDNNNMVYLEKSARSYNSQLSTAVTNYHVRGLQLQQFIADNNITYIDIIKIDIEGAESFLFNNDTSWLSITRNILIEIHSDDNLQQFKTAVEQHGFKVEKRNFEFENLYWAYK